MRKCVFCGKSKLTREHVVPRWVSALFGTLAAGTAQLFGADGKITRFSIRPFDQAVKSVCATCNGGWMSDLELQVKGYLGPMIKTGAITNLDVDQQRVLALWCVKTALMFEAMHQASETVPRREFQKLYSQRAVPKRYHVWIAKRDSYVDATGFELMVSSNK